MIHKEAKSVSLPQRRQAYRVSSAAVSGQQTPRAPDTSPPTLMNWWTIMCRQCFFMSRAWVLSAASRIWRGEMLRERWVMCHVFNDGTNNVKLGRWKHKYLQDILHSDVHLKILLAVRLQPVVWKPVVIWCSKQIAVNHRSRKWKKKLFSVLHYSEKFVIFILLKSKIRCVFSTHAITLTFDDFYVIRQYSLIICNR